jgi:hypothetical protein
MVPVVVMGPPVNPVPVVTLYTNESHAVTPDPLVDKACLLTPELTGKVNVYGVMAKGLLIVTACVPLLSSIFIVLKFDPPLAFLKHNVFGVLDEVELVNKVYCDDDINPLDMAVANECNVGSV